MPHDQITLRLTPEAGAALEAAHAAVGRVIPLHRLAVLALARGAREFARSPALLFATPSKPAEHLEGAAPVEALEAPAPSTSKPVEAPVSGALAQLAADLEALRGSPALRDVVRRAGVHLPTVYTWLRDVREGGAGRLSDATASKLRAQLSKGAAQ